MAGISISLIIIFLLFFILTRETRIKLIKYNRLQIELHLQLIALVFWGKKKTDKKNKSKNKKGLSKHAKQRIITTVFRVVRMGELHIERLALPYPEIDEYSFLRPFRYRIIISSLLAYLETKTEKLTLEDDAIILSPDTKILQYNVTIKCKLYELIYAILVLTVGIIKERNRINVRE